MKKQSCFLLFLLSIILLPIAVIAKQQAPAQSTDGLKLIKKTSRSEFYLNTDADWGRFTTIQLEKATVEFRKHWARDQRNRSGNRPTEENMTRIKTDLSDLLDEVFRQELTKDGVFAISDISGENVMLVSPKIVDLNINAPDRMRDHIGYSLADSKGSMTLELEIYDSVSGTLLARMIDNREDPQKGYMEWTTSGTNKRATRFMFIRSANSVRERLVESRLSALD